MLGAIKRHGAKKGSPAPGLATPGPTMPHAALSVAFRTSASRARVNASQVASVCKARASDTYIHSGEEGVQLFAGIGMTADAHHITAPAPGGEGAIRSMR